jgi:hypothetical protein
MTHPLLWGGLLTAPPLGKEVRDVLIIAIDGNVGGSGDRP